MNEEFKCQNDDELAEWAYRYSERLGNTVQPPDDPTEEQKRIAASEATDTILKLRLTEN